MSRSEQPTSNKTETSHTEPTQEEAVRTDSRQRAAGVLKATSQVLFAVAGVTAAVGGFLMVVAALGWVVGTVAIEVARSVRAGDLWRLASAGVLVVPAVFCGVAWAVRYWAERMEKNSPAESSESSDSEHSDSEHSD